MLYKGMVHWMGEMNEWVITASSPPHKITVNTHRSNQPPPHRHHIVSINIYIAITIIISFSLPCPGVWWRWCWLLCTYIVIISFYCCPPASYVFLLLIYHGDHFYYLPHHPLIYVVIYSVVHFSMMFMTLLDMRSPDINGGGDRRMHTEVLVY